MIKIYAEGNNIVVKIDYKFPANGFYHVFRSQEDSKVNASLCAHNLNDNFHDLVESIRKECYEKGWSDAKSKKKKQVSFSRYFG